MRNLDHMRRYSINNPGMQRLMGDDFVGAYSPKLRGSSLEFVVVASVHDGEWEHVSVSTEVRCPTWDEMNQVKDMFFETYECVMQLHPPKKDYVNSHPNCLHLWRPVHMEIPQPDKDAV